MLAVVFLLLTVFLGYIFISVVTPHVFAPKNLYMHFTSSTRHFPQLFVVFPASFSAGVVFSGWMLYLTSYCFRGMDSPLFYGCMIVSAAMIFITALYVIFKRSFIRDLASLISDFFQTMAMRAPLAVFFCCVLAFAVWLMVHTFYVKNDDIRIAESVYSDFSVHTAIIRSFSQGSNFPTQFPHFPDGTIRYHFMFQFFTGALEFMGMRIDVALNVMSIVTFFNAAMLLYVVAVIITNRAGVGVLAIVFFLFRSSLSGFIYIRENWPINSFMEFVRLVTGKDGAFIGYSSYQEVWGLWNMNVYANQRHFALGISLMLFGIIAMAPLMRKMYFVYEYRSLTFMERMKQFFFTANAWVPERLGRAAGLGLLFGAAAFFHGSAMIALLGMLAVMAFFSKHRLEFLIIAVATFVMSNVEGSFFAPGVELAKINIQLGFIAPDKSPIGIATYIVVLTGAALLLALLGLLMRLKRFKSFFLMFAVPLIITFTLSFTPDVTVNHKFLMISVALLNIFAAYAICVIMGNAPGKVIGVVLIAAMSFTGVIDAFTMNNKNGGDKPASFHMHGAYHEWIISDTRPNDIFLTARYSVNDLLLAGRPIFYGWPYYAWSGGYETDLRSEAYNKMIKPESAEALSRLVKENKISYIVVDRGLYDKADDFDADPEMLMSIYPTVFSDIEDNIFVLKTDYNP